MASSPIVPSLVVVARATRVVCLLLRDLLACCNVPGTINGCSDGVRASRITRVSKTKKEKMRDKKKIMGSYEYGSIRFLSESKDIDGSG
ncbi:hypothetical protein YC2023_099982 [Brassica napus]